MPTTPPPNPQPATPPKDEPRFLSFENVLDRKNKESAEEKAAGIRLLRTYQDDLADAIKGGESLLSMAVAENRRKESRELEKEGPADTASTPVAETPQEAPIKEGVPRKQASAPLPTVEKKLSKPPEEDLPIATVMPHRTLVPSMDIGETPSRPLAPIQEPSPSDTRVPTPSVSTYVGSREENSSRRGIRPLLMGIVVLLLLGGIALGVGLYRKKNAEEPLSALPMAPLLISSYQQKIILKELKAAPLLKELSNIRRDQHYSLGTIVAAIPVIVKEDSAKQWDELMDTLTLLTTVLNTRASAALLRSLDPDFTLGFYERPIGPDAFVIFKSNYYQSSYAEMLAWERFMRVDLEEFLTGQTSIPQVSGTTTITQTEATFQDAIIKNRDVRVLKNAAGSTILLYGFLNQKTLIITTSEDTFSEVVSRLTANVRTR